MIMSRRIHRSLTLVLAIVLAAPALLADGGTYGSYTPYSIFGIGDLAQPGSAYNRSMGGVGIATRNNRFINTLNPAAVTARDSLAFMADYSVYGENRYFRQNTLSGDPMRSVSNTFNMNNCVMSFPIWKSSAMLVGIAPYSSTGYDYIQYEENPQVIGNTGNISYTNSGQGSIYQLFATAGVTFFKKLSLGVEYIHYFGDVEKSFTQTFSESSFTGSSTKNSLYLTADTWKFGLQFEQKVGDKGVICAGATYAMRAPTKGYLTKYVGRDTTTVILKDLQGVDKIALPSEKGIGISYRHSDNFSAELDYARTDWNGTNIQRLSNVSGFTPVLSQSFRAGVEYVPNRNDIRYYYKKITYRAGFYQKDEYYALGGNTITSTGVTLGATLPVFKWYNGLTVAVDLGRRGTLADNLIRENYVNFSIGMNIFDIWFMKPRYD